MNGCRASSDASRQLSPNQTSLLSLIPLPSIVVSESQQAVIAHLVAFMNRIGSRLLREVWRNWFLPNSSRCRRVSQKSGISHPAWPVESRVLLTAAPQATVDSYTVNQYQTLNTVATLPTVTHIHFGGSGFIGQGRTYDFTDHISAFSSPGVVRVQYSNLMQAEPSWWNFEFAAPTGEVLAPGVYLNATRYPYNAPGPGLDVSGDGRGSNTAKGSFTIHSISFYPSGELRSFSASFEHYSEGNAKSRTTGTVEYQVPGNGILGVLANDSDADHDPLSAVLVTGPQHGALTLRADGSFAYTPDRTYFGPDSFTYKANDGTLNSATTTVSLVVTAVPPVANSDTYEVEKNVKFTPPLASGLLSNDFDPGGYPLTAQLVAQPQHGTVSLRSDGTFDYKPAQNYLGPDSFTYKANNGTQISNTTTVNLTVKLFNHAPTLSDQVMVIAENSPAGTIVGTLTGHDGDAGQQLTYWIISSSAPGAVTIDANSGQIIVNDRSAFNYEEHSSISLTVMVSDNGDPSLSATATVTLNLTDLLELGYLPNEGRFGVFGTAADEVITVDKAQGVIRFIVGEIITNVPFKPENIRRIEIYGGGGNDWLKLDASLGTAMQGVLAGGDGNDVLISGVGPDILDGGQGIDEAVYIQATKSTRVSLALTSFQDTGGAGRDLLLSVENLTGSKFSDALTGDANNNTLVGEVGNDTLIGGGGADQLQGDSGNDSISGGAGNDTLIGGAGNDTLYGNDGIDTVSYADANSSVNVNLANKKAAGGAGKDKLDTLENVVGSKFNDQINGNSSVNILDGGLGVDQIVGGPEDTILNP
jgi:Ca2+-binding RTX toxin-like protein